MFENITVCFDTAFAFGEFLDGGLDFDAIVWERTYALLCDKHERLRTHRRGLPWSFSAPVCRIPCI
jgi:hypothetical protein